MPVVFPRFLSLLFLMLSLSVPYGIVGHTYPIPTFYAEFAALALYVGFSASVGWLAFTERHRVDLAAPRVALVLIGFALVLVLQVLVLPTTEPSMNFLGAGFLLTACIVAHAGYWLARLDMGDRALHWGAWALVLGGVFAVFCQVAQTFHLEPRFAPFVVAYNVLTERRPFGNMAQANHLATYLSFAMAGALFLVQTRRLSYWLWLLASIVFAGGEALTVSRGPWLQTAVVVLGALAMGLVQQRHRDYGVVARRGTSRAWLTPLLLIVIFVAVNWAIRWANVEFHLQLAESAAERFQDAGQISPRLALWKYGWTMFASHPLLGVGWGQFPSFQYALVEQLGRVEIANNAHDIVLDLLAKTGVIGVGVLLLGFGAWLWRVLRAPRSVQQIFGLILLGVLAMHALVEYPQQYMFFLLPAAFVFGVLEPAPLRSLRPVVVRVAYGVVVLAGLVSLYPIFQDYRRAEVLYYGTSPEAQYRAAPSFLFNAWGQYGLATLLSMNSADLPGKLAAHRQAMALLPGETVLRRYAVLQALAGDTDAAFDTVRRLKLFAQMLKDWPTQLAAVYKLCDDQGAVLADFKRKLVARYGAAPQAAADDADDGD